MMQNLPLRQIDIGSHKSCLPLQNGGKLPSVSSPFKQVSRLIMAFGVHLLPQSIKQAPKR